MIWFRNKTIVNSNYIFSSGGTCVLKLRAKVETMESLGHRILYGPRREKTCLRGFANNKGADQPAHPRRLISAFVILFLESIISKVFQAKFQYSS